MQFTIALAAFFGLAAAAPTRVHPGTAHDIVITSENTINATGATPFHGPNKLASGGKLTLQIENNLYGSQVNCYVTGQDPSTNEVVVLQTDGSYYVLTETPTTPQRINASIAIPLAAGGESTAINIPSYLTNARVWFAEGELQFFVVRDVHGNPSLVEPSAAASTDPSAGVNWGFIELTYTADAGLYCNISYVDFVGLPLGMTLVGTDGTKQVSPGLTSSSAVTSICQDLAAQAQADGAPWDALCDVSSTGEYLRVLSPNLYVRNNASAFASYWTAYVDRVYAHFQTSNLTVDTQTDAGNVSCSSDGTTLTCDGDNRDYPKPSTADIFGCNSGPFGILPDDNGVHKAVVPRLCAAFNRATFFAPGGDHQPGPAGSTFYASDPSNEYSRIVHKYEVDQRGYAFSYDDVQATGQTENFSGELVSKNPAYLQIVVGG